MPRKKDLRHVLEQFGRHPCMNIADPSVLIFVNRVCRSDFECVTESPSLLGGYSRKIFSDPMTE